MALATVPLNCLQGSMEWLASRIDGLTLTRLRASKWCCYERQLARQLTRCAERLESNQRLKPADKSVVNY